MMQMGDMGDVNPTHINDILEQKPQKRSQQSQQLQLSSSFSDQSPSSLRSSPSLWGGEGGWSDEEGGEEEKLTKEEMVCWRCLEEGDDDPSFHLITPCLCRGDNQFIHRDCLDKWRASSDDPDSYYRCKNCECVYRCDPYFPRKEELSQCALIWGIIGEVFGIFLLFQLLLLGLMGVALILDPNQTRNDFFPSWSQGAIDYCFGLILFAFLLVFFGCGLVGTNNQEGKFSFSLDPFGNKEITGEETEEKKPKKMKSKVVLLIFVLFVLVTCGALIMVFESLSFLFIAYLKRTEEEFRYQSALTEPVTDLKRVPKKEYPSLRKMGPKKLCLLVHRFKIE